MTIDPKSLWATLSPALRRQILDDVAAVLAEVSREVRTDKANPSGAQSGCLRPPVDAAQVVSNQESLRLQYALRQRALELGWHDADIDVDLGLSAASAAKRNGFKELVGRVGLGEIGLILRSEYVCNHLRSNTGLPACQHIRASRVDAAL
ncbi:hypothetical protein NKJ70_31920 [Mesorhizobium sp. M0092]|uniref:hypothetical protein n=1 Tax=Mesorhizobium sp. M0092 TaxID=2956876 RepID=UPI00333B1547